MSFPSHRHPISKSTTLSLMNIGFLCFSAFLLNAQTVRNSPGDGSGIMSEQMSDVLILCGDPVDWSQYHLPETKAEKGAFVYNKLRSRAKSAQTDARAYLDGKGLVYRPFCITNVISARIPVASLEEVRNLPGVRRITANDPVRQEKQIAEPADITIRNSGPEWGIQHIHADSVWAMGYTGQGVVIAGEDTGFEWTHPALRPKYRGTAIDTFDHAYNWHDAIHEINPLNGDTIIDPTNNPCGIDSRQPCDDLGHGTHTMGTMVGEDGENQIGVAPGAKWIACRNMERGWGSPATYLECMEWFLAPTDDEGGNPNPLLAPDVINNSWSCPEVEGCNSDNFDLLRQAVINLKAAGIVVVVSAGNTGSSCGTVSTPLAIFEESFTVGAIDIGDTVANFSSRGPVIIDNSMRTKPNISAPGVLVRSAWLDSTYRNANGTSMAGPHVAGVVALMISANPSLAGQVEVIESILESTARPKTTDQECGNINGSETLNNTFGYGVVDALAAVKAALLVSSLDDDFVRPLNSTPFELYPNPVGDVLQISSEEYSGIEVLRIMAVDGRQVYSARDVLLPAQIDVSLYPQGLYVVQMDSYLPVMIQVIR